MEIRQLSAEIGHAIVQVAEEIIAGQLHDQFIVDPIQGGAGTSLNMNANEVIANRALEILGRSKGSYSFISLNTHVNMSQSTNDIFPTSIHLAVLQMAEVLLITMEHLHEVFAAKAAEFS